MILLFDSSGLIAWGGIAIIAVLIFAETGLLLGLIIPGGETLVFTSGLLVSAGALDIQVLYLLLILAGAGFVGDLSGYYIGKKYGRQLFEKRDTWYFKKQYVQMAEQFLKKYKKRSIVFGKFLPVIRPFTPLISGLSRTPLPFFMLISLAAVLIYMSTFLLAGYYLGNQFPAIKNYIGWILPISIVVVLIPVIIQVRRNRP